jgi:hypothetical protein
MLEKFSENLLNDTIKYFKINYNVLINIETAEEYLASLARLYNCFDGLIDQKCSDFCREAKSEHFCLGEDKKLDI